MIILTFTNSLQDWVSGQCEPQARRRTGPIRFPCYLFCTMSFVLCLLYYAFCTMSFVLCLLYYVFCTMYFVLCLLYLYLSITGIFTNRAIHQVRIESRKLEWNTSARTSTIRQGGHQAGGGDKKVSCLFDCAFPGFI